MSLEEHKIMYDRWDGLNIASLIYPLFVRGGTGVKEPVVSMPGVHRYSIDMLLREIERVDTFGIGNILLFGIPDDKDTFGSAAFADDSIVVQAVHAVKKEFPHLTVMTDVCLCAYTDHGHCGVIQKGERYRDNKGTLEALAAMALAHACAGADVVAPSAMLAGQVAAIKAILLGNGFAETLIMAYSAKFASHFYGPFREAADSVPQFGDRRGYQLDYKDGEHALDRIRDDIAEGANMVMVKPALSYLDIIARAKARFAFPLAVFNVSGEYAMVKHGVHAGLWEEEAIVSELIYAFKRAGADLIITYHAADIAHWKIREGHEIEHGYLSSAAKS